MYVFSTSHHPHHYHPMTPSTPPSLPISHDCIITTHHFLIAPLLPPHHPLSFPHKPHHCHPSPHHSHILPHHLFITPPHHITLSLLPSSFLITLIVTPLSPHRLLIMPHHPPPHLPSITPSLPLLVSRLSRVFFPSF